MYNILVVDDEPKNLKLIKLYLEDEQYTITTANDGLQCWNILNTADKHFDLLLLDRMMPNMDGMEVLQLIKKDDTLKYLPVIMQTAAAEKSQILEGMQAGVFHYLTKPYDSEQLISIVQSCLMDCLAQRELRTAVAKQKKMLGLITGCQIEFKTIQDAHNVSTYIAALFPEPKKVVMGILELLINAVEHGNLGISYEEKTKLKQDNLWEQEIASRLQNDLYKDKFVKVTYKHKGSYVLLHIIDQGKGFDWQKYININPERLMHNHGRGIALANTISFEKIQYRGCGNEVLCAISLQKTSSK